MNRADLEVFVAMVVDRSSQMEVTYRKALAAGDPNAWYNMMNERKTLIKFFSAGFEQKFGNKTSIR